MKHNTDKIDRYFRIRFEQFEHKPQDAVWNGIASKLGHSRKKGMVVFLLRIAAGMTLILSLGIGYYFISRTGKKAEQPVLSERQTTRIEKDIVPHKAPLAKADVIGADVQNSGRTNNAVTIHRTAGDPVVTREVMTESQEALVEISRSSNPELVPVDVPADLHYRVPAAVPALTSEEALALLLQDTETPAVTNDSDPDHWVLGSEIAPLYSYRTLASDNLGQDKVDALNEYENGMLAYAGGISIAFNAGKRLSVQSGLYFSRYGQEKTGIETINAYNTEYASTDKNNYGALNISNSTGIIYSDRPEQTGYDRVISNTIESSGSKDQFAGMDNQNYMDLSSSGETGLTALQYFDYLELPLTVRYKIIDRKFDFCLSGGLVTNFLVGNVVKLEEDGQKSKFGKTDDISEVNYQGSVGLGFVYPIKDGFAVSLEPRFRYYLNPIYKSEFIDIHPYSFGFFAGVSYTF